MDTGLRMRAMSELLSTVYSAGSGSPRVDAPGPPPLPRRPVRSGILSTCAPAATNEKVRSGRGRSQGAGRVRCLFTRAAPEMWWVGAETWTRNPVGPGETSPAPPSTSSYGRIWDMTPAQVRIELERVGERVAASLEPEERRRGRVLQGGGAAVRGG